LYAYVCVCVFVAAKQYKCAASIYVNKESDVITI